MTYTFKLHPGVKFHDGTTLTSADVKATYDRLRNPPPGVVSTRKATFGDIGTIETPDPNTVVFKMKAVNAAMLEHFASPWNCIYAAKDLAADPERAEDQDQRHRPVHLRRARQGQPRLRQEERQLLQARACPISTASRASSCCRPPPCSTPCRAARCWANSAASRRPSATGWCRRWATRSASRNRAGRSICWSPSTSRRSRSTTCACARRCCMAIDRWGGSQGLSRISTLRSVGGVIRPGSPYATPEAELVKLPGFSQGHQGLARGGQAPAGGGRRAEPQIHPAQPQPRHALHAGRHLPGRPVAADRRHVEHKQFDTAPYLATMNAGNHDVAIDFSNLFMDELEPRPRQVSVGRRARRRTARARTTPSSTSSTTSRCASATPRSARR